LNNSIFLIKPLNIKDINTVAYNLIGEFYEACDCELICPCWAGIAPDMGSCTGLFAWEIQHGNVEGMDVSGSKVVVLSSGKSCDDSQNMLVLVDSSFNAALSSAFDDPGPWHDVFTAQSFSIATRSTQQANISIKEIGKTISISVVADSIITKAELSFTVQPVQIEGVLGGTLLINRVVGSDFRKDVKVGIVDTPADPSQNGLNLLADILDPNDHSLLYTFDLDVSRVTAVRGNFHYVNP
jgi:hypothetical protein